MSSNSAYTSDRRAPVRQPMDGEVVVEIQQTELRGSGQNISTDGVFFIADASVPVKVQIDGEDGQRVGEIVRIESMGGGKVGIALRFSSD